ncbi:hypothetical protein [uncultured Alteromonas sp.]|jgi:glutathione synthase/RimK-type ligase-like ATP-grasp enzyme|uniref:ATP-grasp domain-containing protein n=1 Tax=uncultured Alteromonas sp. TaxID=179113 RepID=UPI0030DC81CE
MSTTKLPTIGLLYLDHVLRFFDKSNFKSWPDKIETVCYHWGNDKARFVREVKSKNIDILIGNIPATAYETFREIARELPDVRFLPSMDTQFANKSKENVTHFCEKHDLPIPKTDIFYEKDEAMAFLRKTSYPKIIKKSYGPSNYGGYFVHKVDSFKEVVELLNKKKYHPIYVQEFVPMKADIRVMLIGHKPVCAFWRRPPEGEWLTNTSQGGSMDYSDVPKEALQIAVNASKAAKAEYWASDIALGVDGKYRILECATAFAAFPYIRDWIGQYIMWTLCSERFKKPHIPLYNWEELGKIRTPLLRTMRNITFGEYTPSSDSADSAAVTNPELYPLLPVELQLDEEWPSESWNFQDNYTPKSKAKIVTDLHLENQDVSEDDGLEDVIGDGLERVLNDSNDEFEVDAEVDAGELILTTSELENFFAGVKGIGPKLTEVIISTLGEKGTSEAITADPSVFLTVKNIQQKKVDAIIAHWDNFKTTLVTTDFS